MRGSHAARRVVASATMLAATLTVGGCVGAINAGLDLLGLGGDTGRAGSQAAAPQGAAGGDAVASIYEYGPTSDLRRYTAGRPSFPGYGFLAGATPFSCTLAPRGAYRVLPIPGEVPMTPLHQWGPVQLGVAGVGAANALALASGRGSGMATLLEGASRLGTGGEGCRFTAFLYVSIWPSSTEPVEVLWE